MSFRINGQNGLEVSPGQGLGWLIRVGLAAFFIAVGMTKIVAPGSRSNAVSEPLWLLLAAVEVGGGLLLLVPRFAGAGATVLAMASGCVLLCCMRDINSPPLWPIILVIVSLEAVAYTWRPWRLARVRLERMVDRFMDLQQASKRGGVRG
jgi:hypothetical protein